MPCALLPPPILFNILVQKDLEPSLYTLSYTFFLQIAFKATLLLQPFSFSRGFDLISSYFFSDSKSQTSLSSFSHSYPEKTKNEVVVYKSHMQLSWPRFLILPRMAGIREKPLR